MELHRAGSSPRIMNKPAIVASIVAALRADFEAARASSVKTRAAGNDAESKAEGKYDTRSTEDNYLADGLAKQAHSRVRAGQSYDELVLRAFGGDIPIDVGALVQLELADNIAWFFLGPAGGGIEIEVDGNEITVVTPESPLGGQLMGRKQGDLTESPSGRICAVY